MWVYCGKGSGCGKSMILVSVAMRWNRLCGHRTMTCVVTSRLVSTLQYQTTELFRSDLGNIC